MNRRIFLSSTVLSLCLLLGLVAGTGTPASAATPIQPGARISSDGNGCTMNFIYRDVVQEPTVVDEDTTSTTDTTNPPRDSGSDSSEPTTTTTQPEIQELQEEPFLYAGTAGHCVEGVGRRVANADGDFGTVAFRALDDDDDFAFIQIDRDKEHLVNPTMLGFSGPKGTISGPEAKRGDTAHVYGHGLIVGQTELTRPRSGTLTRADANYFAATLPVIFGDSGGPVLHEDGSALGIVAHLVYFSTDLGTTLDGNTVERALSVAAENGLPLEVVPG